jgi:tetratricopeptide (TPR) repeat protein
VPATSFARGLENRRFRSRNLFFFGFGSPFGFGGGWGLFGYPWFSPFGYGYDYGLSPGAYGGPLYSYTPEYYVPELQTVPGGGLGAIMPPSEQQPSDSLGRAIDYAQQGEIDFKEGRYEQAARNWHHALVEQPGNAGLVLLLAQALFQTGRYNEAAGAVQQALAVLPSDQWGVVVSKYARLYGATGDYTTALRALEKAREERPKEPALFFLLGYHYTFLGYPAEAVRELNDALKLAPKDELARKLRDRAARRMPPQLSSR